MRIMRVSCLCSESWLTSLHRTRLDADDSRCSSRSRNTEHMQEPLSQQTGNVPTRRPRVRSGSEIHNVVPACSSSLSCAQIRPMQAFPWSRNLNRSNSHLVQMQCSIKTLHKCPAQLAQPMEKRPIIVGKSHICRCSSFIQFEWLFIKAE